MTMQNEPASVRWSRRQVLKTGMFSFGAGLVPEILRRRAIARDAGNSVDQTSVIFVNMGGGPSHHETYDPKPDAPAEYRGPMRAISTSLPGVQFCELLPLQAKLANQLTILRGVHHEQASHIAMHIVETGYDLRSSLNAIKGEMPSVGSIISRQRGGIVDGIPAFVSMPKPFAYSSPHWVGSQYNFFAVDDDPSAENFQVSSLALSPKLDVPRLRDRKQLLDSFGEKKSSSHRVQTNDALEELTEQAFELIAGERAQRAFDISREHPRLRDRYGRNTFGQRLLLARRLVEANVPFVHVRTGGWDDHKDLQARMSERCPEFDAGVATLIEDLQTRGLAKNVLVVCMGEFGRTPRFNVNGGRDHWPRVMSVMMAGGHYEHGQVVGASDQNGATVTEAPYRPQNVLGMMYRHLGIDPGTTYLDFSGRPRHVLEVREPIRELG